MNCNFLINNEDISEIYEELDKGGGASNFNLSNIGDHYFKEDKHPLQFLTSAGNQYLGGYNELREFKINSSPINIALKGRRPLGTKLLSTKEVGTYYIRYISDGANKGLWISTSDSEGSGEKLSDYIQCIYIELQAAGGGGGGSGLVHASAGGGAGGYALIGLDMLDYDSIRIEVGTGGTSSRNADGSAGGDVSVYSGSTLLAQVYGGSGGSSSDAGGAGGSVNDPQGLILGSINGGAGGDKEKLGADTPSQQITLSMPEEHTWTRGGQSGGTSEGNNYGGGGGASVFASGAPGNSRTTGVDASQGAGGSGAGWTAAAQNAGGKGGDGVIKIWY